MFFSSNKEKKGLSIGSLMAALSVLVVVAIGLASLSVTHLRFSSRANASFRASNLARSVLAEAIARSLEDQNFGKTSESLEIDRGAGLARLTFDVDQAREWGVESSTNNLEETTSVLNASGQSIAAETLHLVAQGESGGVLKTVEAVLILPSFPWVIASEGKIEASDGVLVGSLPEGQWPPERETLLPADILSNSQATGAVFLGPSSEVLGNVETQGTITLSSGASIRGELLENSDPGDIPVLDVSSFDPEISDLLFDSLDNYTDDGNLLVLNGSSRRQGDMFVSGGLDLQEAQLFVDGNLQVKGRVEGDGVLIVTGDLTIESGATLNGATKLAMIVEGQVHISGVDASTSQVQGVVYAGEGLEAENITLVGALISHSSVVLKNVMAIGDKLTGGGGTGEVDPDLFLIAQSELDAGLSGKSGAGFSTEFSLDDLSRFISVKDRIRVVSWFEK